MKKKLVAAKTAQALIFAAIAIVCLIIVFTDHELYQAIGHDPSVRSLCILLWLTLVIAFIINLLDMKAIGKLLRNYNEMHYSVSNDPISGIANRYSCDTIIEKYSDKPLPP